MDGCICHDLMDTTRTVLCEKGRVCPAPPPPLLYSNLDKKTFLEWGECMWTLSEKTVNVKENKKGKIS